MAFYNPTWIRKLIKQDAEQINTFLNKKKDGKYVNDLRDYIDSIIPYALWLDIDQIRFRIIDQNKDLLDELAQEVYLSNKTVSIEEANKVKTAGLNNISALFLDSYKKVINTFIDKYGPGITTKEFEEKLNSLQGSESDKIKTNLKTAFGKTFTLKTLSKPNESVMVIFPRFDSYTFNKIFKDSVEELLMSGKYIEGDYSDAFNNPPANILYAKLNNKANPFFTKFQNIGHIEVDVISTKTREVKRGQVSPRLIQALIATPNNQASLIKVSREFSKQTLQSETRLMVRKRFSGSKLIFEMLIEGGIPVALPETQKINLRKAAKERSFGPGAGITNEIRKNPNFLLNLETSKTAKEYLKGNVYNILKNRSVLAQYTSNTTITEKTNLKVPVHKASVSIKTTGTKTAPKPTKLNIKEKLATVNIVNLTDLINSRLFEQIKKNMGTGNRRDVLNFRTGRLARSAKIERISESRQGMITAFYSYMKNPYATFSEGGRQQFPRSRDPKLLISKSIRELAAPLVTNRLRAVNV